MNKLYFFIFTLICILYSNVKLDKDKYVDYSILYIELSKLDDAINDNPWIIKYNNYKQYNSIYNDISALQLEINMLKKTSYDKQSLSKIHKLEEKLRILKTQEELLKNYKNDPYKELTTPQNLDSKPNITNPFLIPSGFSYIRSLKHQITIIDNNLNTLQTLIKQLDRKLNILNKLDKKSKDEIEETKDIINELTSMQKAISVYVEILKRNFDSDIQNMQQEITDEVVKLVYIIIAIAFIFILFILLKVLLKNYVILDDVDKNYILNKLINVLNLSITIFILVFAYIENATYILAVIGFVSAGLAIAMKDWFMSFFGWIIIISNGSIKPGDRIKIIKDNTTYVGDVIDVSMLKITIYEDVTYTTYIENRRAGRIVFIPNNLIFTTMIANYSHSNMKTVWDGVDITITFNSNYKKALDIVKNIAKKESNIYTNMAKTQLKKLTDKYSFHDLMLDPKAFSFLVPNGIKISVWFQTNSFTTLTQNSVISSAIIDAFNKEDDIEIAYPTTRIITESKNLGSNVEGIF